MPSIEKLTRALIVNADDFGLTPGVNAGILDAHLQGILTSASLFARAPATDEAIEIARRTPTLGVGCHLTLVDGHPTLPAADVPTLAPDGHFRPTWLAFIRAAMTGRVASTEIERELEAQVDCIRSNGIRVTHLDAHKHVHTYPPVFAIIARLARRFGIRAVRVPCERPPARLAARYAFIPKANRQALENLALAPWAWRARRILTREGLPPAASFFGRVLTGLFTSASFHAVLQSLPPGVSEMMMHPGYVDAALERVRTRLREARATEVSILTDPATLETIRREGIVLLNHADTETHSHVA
jgi:hopanoid biosynthesis associated protein HpnK